MLTRELDDEALTSLSAADADADQQDGEAVEQAVRDHGRAQSTGAVAEITEYDAARGDSSRG